MGNLLSGKKVGIIGFGRIGKQVFSSLVSFGCEFAYYDPFVKKSSLGIRKLSKKNLLKWADIVTIHVSSKEKILTKEDLRLLNKGSWLINTSRGGTVDEQAIYDLLEDGHLCGAALDVFDQEPYNGVLKQIDKVILTPHIGSYAKEARIKMEKEAVNNLLKGLKKE